MMKVLRRSRRVARLAACTALALGLAGTAGALSAPAQARVTATLTRYHLVASWGANGNAELGDGTTISRWQPGDVRTSNDLTQVAAGLVHALAVRSDGTVWAWARSPAWPAQHRYPPDGSPATRSTPDRSGSGTKDPGSRAAHPEPARPARSAHVLERDVRLVVTRDGFVTSVPGVFAVGDVRAGSVKAGGLGGRRGSVVISAVHSYLAGIKTS